MVRLLITLMVSAAAHAGPDEGYFAVIVSDVDQARGWYVSTFHLKEVSRLTDDQGRYDIVNLSRDGLYVELIELADASPRPDGRLHGIFKVGFLVSDIDEFISELPAETGRPEVTEDTRNDLRIIQLKDLDGNIIQIMSRCVRPPCAALPVNPN